MPSWCSFSSDMDDLKSAINDVLYADGVKIPVEFEYGRINPTTGEKTSSGVYFRTVNPIPWSDSYRLLLLPNTGGYLLLYGSEGEIITPYGSNKYFYDFWENAKYVDFSFYSNFHPTSFDICMIPYSKQITPKLFNFLQPLIDTQGTSNNGLKSTHNLLLVGDKCVVNRSHDLVCNIPSGEYVIRGYVESDDTDETTCSLVFYKHSINDSGSAINVSIGKVEVQRNKHFVTHIFLSETANGVTLYSAKTAAGSTGDTSIWTGLTIANKSSDYGNTPTYTMQDYVARNKDSSNILLANTEIKSSTDSSFSFVIHRGHTSSNNIVLYCDAKCTKTASGKDYPRIRIGVITDRNFDRWTTWYLVGGDNVFLQKEWRAPAYFWDNRDLYVELYVPAYYQLAVRNMHYREESSVSRISGGLVFHGRPGTCNIAPELSLPGVQMACSHGYNSVTVIPKISSDGVWFAYHDDQWDVSTTRLRNGDGSKIIDATYQNGTYFHEIPFSYLQQFDCGIAYGSPTFDGTKVMRLSDYFEYLAKVGVAPRFSMHPAYGINTEENLTSLRRLCERYGLLNKLTILVNDISTLYPIFRDDIAGYCFGNSVGAQKEGSNRIDAGFTKAKAAKETYNIKTQINCGLWTDGIFADPEYAKTLVNEILDEGFTAGVFTYSFIGTDGTMHNYLWSEDIRWLASIGVTEFTDGYNTSNGLNW